MGFFSSIIKVALTPVAIVKDVANVVTGQEPNATENLLESAKDDFNDFIDGI